MTLQDARVRTHFVSGRDVLLSHGDCTPLHRDLELHLLANGIRHDEFAGKRLNDGLAALALYMASRPRFEAFGWTISLQEPRVNFFFSGSAREGTVVGRAFLEGVHPAPQNLFYAETARPFAEVQRSSVDVDGTDLFGIVEQYCSRSDQQPGRFFFRGGAEAAFLSALPGVEHAWFDAVGGDEVFALFEKKASKLISERRMTFRCGCDSQRITKILVDLYKDDAEDLFRGDPAVEAECPRCAAKHEVSRESFETLRAAEGHAQS